MEAATLGRSGASAPRPAPALAARVGGRTLARLLDRHRPDRAGGGAPLRHPRRAELPPRRDRHRQPRPPRRLRPRDERGLVQRVDAAGLLRRLLGLDAAGRHPRIRAARDLRRRRGGDGPGRLPDRGRAARPAGGPLGGGAGRGQPDDALVLAGGARLRAGRPLRRALGALLAAGRTERRAARLRLVGDLVGARDRHPLLRRLPDPRRGGDAAAPAGLARRASPGWRSWPAARSRSRRWRSTRCRSATPTGSATSASATGSPKRRPPSSPARPATSSPGRSGPGSPSCRWR